MCSPSRRQFLAGTGAACGAALAGSPTAAAGGPRSTATNEQVSSDIERLVDEAVETSVHDYDIPGASVAVVSDGSRSVTKGYGVADRDTESPVDPDETPFRIGSVSKPVVATAVMDLVERGEIDPDVGVNQYLDVPIGSDGDDPVTLADLGTHRGGFEATNRGMWIPDAADLRPLASYLRADPQSRLRTPGGVGSYSNFGYALVEQVLAAHADKPFYWAIDDLLVAPAGMTRSSFRQSLPGSLAEAHATGHGATGTYRKRRVPAARTTAGRFSRRTSCPYCSRLPIVNTGTGVVRSTRSVVLPRRRSLNPCRPWVPMTMQSASASLAYSVISLAIEPNLTAVVTSTAVST